MKILFYELSSGSLPRLEDMNLDLKENTLHILHSAEDIYRFISQNNDIKIFVTDTPSYDILSEVKSIPDVSTVLVTSLPISQYSSLLKDQDEKLLDHIIASYISPEWTQRYLKITIEKILYGNIFGLEKYLLPNSTINKVVVTSSSDRPQYNNEVFNFAREHNLGSYVSRLIFSITEELLMNAIYDAPVKEGVPIYNHLPRTTTINLQPHEYPTLSYGFDGISFGIAISDPFGAINKKTFFDHIKKSITRKTSSLLIKNEGGGAGLGILKILHSCHSFICNVENKKQSEFIAVINTKSLPRDLSKVNRSVHFFEKEL